MSSTQTVKQSVLIIEDETTQRRLLQEHLQSLNYNVIVAVDGKEGLALWEQHPSIRIVITDLTMPYLNGFEVVRNIRKKETSHTYIMVLTTMEEKSALLKALTLGADDFVSKPLIKLELELRMKAAKRVLRLEDHDRLVATMAQLAARRSGEMDYHLKRTQEYCRLIAEDLRTHYPELGLTQQSVEDIANISALHDIGQISIPDGLLNKRGKFTPKEYDIIKEHTTNGGEILESLYNETGSQFLQLGWDMALCHHERWDGTGYPSGLKGEEIPLAARIMAFADAFDAMLSRRAYKDPLPPSHAETVILEQKGKQFDPIIVESFERNKENFLDIHYKYPEPDDMW